jgi:hypothetical protein
VVKQGGVVVQHEPWVGTEYRSGIQGKRICIVGNSHWTDGPDTDDFTIGVVTDVISRKQNIAFFNQIKNYFGFEDHAAFWSRVIFFNYLPEVIGGPEDRFLKATDEQVKRGQSRFHCIIGKRRPDIVMVFSNEAWSNLPKTREEQTTGKNALALDEGQFPGFSWGTYAVGDGHIVKAFGLRHPQGADGTVMRQAVRHILEQPLASGATAS